MTPYQITLVDQSIRRFAAQHSAFTVKLAQILAINNMLEGYIYILVNPGLKKNLLKIGRTTRDPEIRSVEMSQGTGVPLPFYVAYSEKTFDCETAERRIHQELARCRVNDSREFFVLPLKDAISKVRVVCVSIISTSELLRLAAACLEEEKREQAIPYWEQAAERGSAEAQYYLCQMYMEGWGGLDDFDVGLSYLEKAANQKYGKAELELAGYYADGIFGGEQYAEKAIYWGTRAAEHGFIKAATIVGNMYAVERPGVEKNGSKALYWFRKAADAGDAYAQYQVGASYEFGFGVEKSLENAFSWYRKSRNSGYKTQQEYKIKSLYYIRNKKQLDLEEIIAKLSEKHTRPMFIRNIMIDKKTNIPCLKTICPNRGVIQTGDKCFCINHYLESLLGNA